MEKRNVQRTTTVILLTVYLIVLTWIILFKLQFSFSELDSFRGINLIPFGESAVVNNKIDFAEIYENILVFVPLGIYLSMIKNDWSFLKKTISAASLSLFYEITQFIFAIGASDITDLIGNTLGGIIGILIYNIFYKLLKVQDKTNRILNVIAEIATTIIIILVALILWAN